MDKPFDSRDAAIVWICKNQIGRRNISDQQRDYIMGKRYDAEKKIQGGAGGNRFTVIQSGQNVQSVQRRETKDGTAGRIGRDYGVDGKTVRRNAEYAKSVDTLATDDPTIKPAILSGKTKLPKSTIIEVSKLPEAERKEAVQSIKSGTPIEPKKKPLTNAEMNVIREANARLKNEDSTKGMFTPDKNAIQLCSDIEISVNLINRSIADVTFSELSEETIAATLEAANKLMGVALKISHNLKGEKQ